MPQVLQIDSIDWFSYETRAASLRLIAGGDQDEFEDLIDDAMMADPMELRQVLKFLALFSFGAVFRHHNGSPIADRYIDTELRLAEDLASLPTYTDTTKYVDTEGNNMTVKRRMLISIGGRTSLGAGLAYDNLRRGDIVDMSDDEADRYERLGYACADLKCDIRDLPAPYNTPIWQR
jgi:hypothetical protein